MDPLLIGLAFLSLVAIAVLIILFARLTLRFHKKGNVQSPSELELLYDSSEKRISKLFSKEKLMTISKKIEFNQASDNKVSIPSLLNCEIMINADMGNISYTPGEHCECQLWSLQHKTNTFKAYIGKRQDINADLQERHGLSSTSDIYKLSVNRNRESYATIMIVYTTDFIFLCPYEVEKFPEYTVRNIEFSSVSITSSEPVQGLGTTPLRMDRIQNHCIQVNF